MNLVIFDDRYGENFYPLSFERSTGDLRVGILKLRQRIAAYFSSENSNIIMSSELEELYKERHPNWKINEIPAGENLFVNSRVKVTERFVEKCKTLKNGYCLCVGDTVIAAKVFYKKEIFISSEMLDFSYLKRIETELKTWDFLWDFIAENSKMIQQDFEDFFYEKDNYFETETGVSILNPYNVWIGEGAEMSPGVIIDARNGAVYLHKIYTDRPSSILIFINSSIIK